MSTANRRDFLKMFGVGTAIIPIIGGLPVLAAEAKIIEAPKVEIVDSATSFGTFMREGLRDPHKMGISVLLHRQDGETKLLHANNFECTTVDIGVPYLDGIGVGLSMRRIKFRIEGQCLADEAGALLSLMDV